MLSSFFTTDSHRWICFFSFLYVLRHSYATHLLENGTNIRTMQAFLGHACVETTMIYMHVMEDQKDLTLSPLDSL